MENKLLAQSNNSVVLQQDILAEKKLQISKFVKNVKDEELRNFAISVISYGLVFKGQNKTEEEVSLLAQVFCSECKKRFAYLTILQMREALEQSKYGEYGITVEGLVNCIDNYYSYETQKLNSNIEQEILQLSAPKEEDKELTQQEKIDFLKNAFKFYRKVGRVGDINGKLWEYVREYTQYKPTFTDRRRYYKDALQSTYEWFFQKNKFRYKFPKRVEKDIKLVHSDIFRKTLVREYKEYWLRDFFNRSKWAEIIKEK